MDPMHEKHDLMSVFSTRTAPFRSKMVQTQTLRKRTRRPDNTCRGRACIHDLSAACPTDAHDWTDGPVAGGAARPPSLALSRAVHATDAPAHTRSNESSGGWTGLRGGGECAWTAAGMRIIRPNSVRAVRAAARRREADAGGQVHREGSELMIGQRN